MARRPGLALILAASLALLAGCIPDTRLPATCQDASVSFAATLADDRLDPATFAACRDQQVTITITVEQAGILHLHGYDDLLSAQDVTAGQEAELTFPAAHAGQFRIALHPQGGSAELNVGTLVVHDV
jgi:hypothetical protein